MHEPARMHAAAACVRAMRARGAAACVIDTMYQLIHSSAQTHAGVRGELNFRIEIFANIRHGLEKDEFGAA